MRMMGFGREEKKDTPDVLLPTVEEPKEPVKSLVRVRFDCFDKELTYFNDRFDLKEGDRVFVSGKLAGKVGYITSVTTKFKIRLSDFERVIAVAQTPIHGSYVWPKSLGFIINQIRRCHFGTLVLIQRRRPPFRTRKTQKFLLI